MTHLKGLLNENGFLFLNKKFLMRVLLIDYVHIGYVNFNLCELYSNQSTIFSQTKKTLLCRFAIADQVCEIKF